jgi:type IV pilus assembly protein PilQ
VEINSRTNTLIVKDTKEKLAEMKRLIDALDKRELQVLIEARIVEVTHSHARELGVQWGGHFNTTTQHNFPNTIGVTGGAGANPNSGQGGGSLVNLPTSGPATGAIGLTIGHVNGTALLDMRLMALETAGKGRIVSMPKITTMNNKEALIESGQEVPYQTVSSEGTKTEFKKATLSLKVTPHVTPDKHIRLQIETSKDEPNYAQAIGGVPPIFTKKATTEVIVSDGDTTVIGGLFKDFSSGQNDKVPLFGDIPILGWLFKKKGTTSTGEELLIFITPKVVE